MRIARALRSATLAAHAAAKPRFFSVTASNRQRKAMPPGGYESEAVRPKLFIPGPIEFSPEVI